MDIYDSSVDGGSASFSQKLYRPPMSLSNRPYLSHSSALILGGMLDRGLAAARGRTNADFGQLLQGKVQFE
jgi:hypothetical protein